MDFVLAIQGDYWYWGLSWIWVPKSNFVQSFITRKYGRNKAVNFCRESFKHLHFSTIHAIDQSKCVFIEVTHWENAVLPHHHLWDKKIIFFYPSLLIK